MRRCKLLSMLRSLWRTELLSFAWRRCFEDLGKNMTQFWCHLCFQEQLFQETSVACTLNVLCFLSSANTGGNYSCQSNKILANENTHFIGFLYVPATYKQTKVIICEVNARLLFQEPHRGIFFSFRNKIDSSFWAVATFMCFWVNIGWETFNYILWRD